MVEPADIRTGAGNAEKIRREGRNTGGEKTISDPAGVDANGQAYGSASCRAR